MIFGNFSSKTEHPSFTLCHIYHLHRKDPGAPSHRFSSVLYSSLQWFSKCGLQASRITLKQELVSNAVIGLTPDSWNQKV